MIPTKIIVWWVLFFTVLIWKNIEIQIEYVDRVAINGTMKCDVPTCIDIIYILKDEVLLTVSCPIFPSILIAKNLLTGSLKNRSIDNLETQKKSISMKNSQFFDYLLYAKSK